jgi:trehalose synthase
LIPISDYEPIAGSGEIEELRRLAGYVRHKKLQNINSTPVGGGVAEILTRMIPLLQDLGIDASWDVITGGDAFFQVTKAMHNALHGAPLALTEDMKEIYRETMRENLARMEFSGGVVYVHDPQPAGLIEARHRSGGQWMWRCHIDVSRPAPGFWEFLQPWVGQYDLSVFSMPEFARPLSIPQYLVAPSIDPLSEKNRELQHAETTAVLERYGLDPGRPILTQISRFDRLKDPLGVIAAYRMVKKRHDCQLLLAGGGAPDDPEGAEVLAEVRRESETDSDIHIVELPPYSDFEINALVRGSTIVFQKSIREGFGLTVSEALWKRKPVIGGATGGIKTQILNGVTGFLVHSPEGAANRALQLLNDPNLRDAVGQNGHLHVKQNFLITRHVKDYLLLMLALDHRHEHVVSLAA